MKSPVHANAAGLSHVERSGGSNRASNRQIRPTARRQVRNVTVVETDFGEILLGLSPIGLPVLLAGPVRLSADARIGNEADKDHRRLSRIHRLLRRNMMCARPAR